MISSTYTIWYDMVIQNVWDKMIWDERFDWFSSTTKIKWFKFTCLSYGKWNLPSYHIYMLVYRDCCKRIWPYQRGQCNPFSSHPVSSVAQIYVYIYIIIYLAHKPALETTNHWQSIDNPLTHVPFHGETWPFSNASATLAELKPRMRRNPCHIVSYGDRKSVV